MFNPRILIRALYVFSLSVAILPIALSISSAYAANSPVTAFDKDSDGTLDLAEVKAAAGAVFDRLEKENDGTLDRKETGGRIVEKEFKAADPDNDGTLTKDEYLALAEKLFNAANPDKDGTLDAKELDSESGRALVRLMR